MGGSCTKQGDIGGLQGPSRPTRPPVFGSPLEKVLERDFGAQRSPYEVPKVVIMLVKQVRERGLQEQGILLSSGEAAVRKRVRSEVDAGRQVEYRTLPVHACAGLLKDFLAFLPDPVTTTSLEQEWVQVADAWDNAHSVQPEEEAVRAKKAAVNAAKELMTRIPLPNRCLLWLILHLADMIIDNKEANGVGMEDACRCLKPLFFKKSAASNTNQSVSRAPGLEEDRDSSLLIATMLLYQCHNDLFADIMHLVSERVGASEELQVAEEAPPRSAKPRPPVEDRTLVQGPVVENRVPARAGSSAGSSAASRRAPVEDSVQNHSIAELLRRVEELEARNHTEMRKMREEVSIANQNCELATEKMDHMMQEVAKELNKLWGRLSNVENATAKILEDHETVKKQAKLMRKSATVDVSSVLEMQAKISKMEDELDRHAIARDRLYVDMSRLQSYLASSSATDMADLGHPFPRLHDGGRRVTLPPMGEEKRRSTRNPRAGGASHIGGAVGPSWGVGEGRIGHEIATSRSRGGDSSPPSGIRHRQIATAMSRAPGHFFGVGVSRTDSSSGYTKSTTPSSSGLMGRGDIHATFSTDGDDDDDGQGTYSFADLHAAAGGTTELSFAPTESSRHAGAAAASGTGSMPSLSLSDSTAQSSPYH